MIALRALPWKLIGYAIGVLLALAAFNTAMSFIPGTDQWRGKRAVAENVQLRGRVSTLEREAAGNAEIGQAVETYHTREIIIREGTAEAIAQARSAPDASTPLDPVRADRLRTADNRLCDASPGICASPDLADRGEDGVPASDPAR